MKDRHLTNVILKSKISNTSQGRQRVFDDKSKAGFLILGKFGRFGNGPAQNSLESRLNPNYPRAMTAAT
jgi:hypothetical protein